MALLTTTEAPAMALATIKIPLSRGKFALIDEDDFDEISKYKWHADAMGYAVRFKKASETGSAYIRICVYMHRLVAKCPADKVVDHVNHNQSDNRKSNLEISNKSSNGLNRKGPQSNNTSGILGVNWVKDRNKWEARIKIGITTHNLGRFSCKEDAMKVRREAEIKYGVRQSG